MGRVDSYDFHALEVIQCMAERRKGGETGVAALQALRGEAVWKAMKAGKWASGGWDPHLFEACLCRSQTLTQPATFSHRHPTPEQIRAWVKEPVAYRIEYRDGLKATMLLIILSRYPSGRWSGHGCSKEDSWVTTSSCRMETMRSCSSTIVGMP